MFLPNKNTDAVGMCVRRIMKNAALSVGDLVQVKVPLTMPGPYDEFHPNWINFAIKIDGSIVKLKDSYEMSHSASSSIYEKWLDGWHIDNPNYCKVSGLTYFAGKACASWMPSEWLHPIENTIAKAPCDCSLQQIINSGCHNSNHV